MNIAPFMACHRPQSFGFNSTTAASISQTMPATGAGRQKVFDDKAGTGQRQQTNKADEIDNKIQRRAFHKITWKYKVSLCENNNYGNL